jgi:hypothetical protein
LALKLYIAYGTAADQVTALRLQALGAVNGLSVYVPPAFTRQNARPESDQQSEANLRDADVVLGVVTSAMSEACRHELDTARSLGKNTILMAAPALASQLEPYFPGNLVAVNPADPAQAELAIVQFLKKTEMEQDTRKALIAVGTLALGLLLFARQE